MTPDILDRLSKLEAEATAEWTYEPERYSALCLIGNKPHDDRWIAHFQPAFNGEANAQLAVALRNHARDLIAVARAAEELVGTENIGKTVDTSINWSAGKHESSRAISAIMNGDALWRLVQALAALKQKVTAAP